MSVRRMLPFILLNIVVSAVVVLAILYFWENRTAVSGETNAGPVQATAVAQRPISQTNPLNQPPILATETAVPDEGPTVHIVKAGDTLSIISNIYSVSTDDIIAANNLANPDILFIGQELVIPIGGLATAVPPEPTPPPSDVLPTPIPTEPVDIGNNVVVTITAVIAPGQLADEAVQIRNTGTDPVALLGWKLAAQDGRFYKFGQATLFGNSGDILVHSKAGQNGPTDYYWGLAEPVWSSGQLVTLLDAEDNIVATFIVP